MIATYRIDRRKENILHQMIGDSVNKIIMKSCSDKTNEICLITTLESGENETVDSMQSLQNENGNKINDISHPKNDVQASTERRHRDRATTVTKSSDDDEIECILSHARSTRDRVTTARSSDDEIEQELQLLDSNEFCTTLRLPGRVYEAVEPLDNPKAIIHHSKIDYVEKGSIFRRVVSFPNAAKSIDAKKGSLVYFLGPAYEVEVSTVIGLAEEYKHLVGATHSDDADFHSVVKLVQQGYKMRRSDWEKGFVDMFVATEDIGQQRKTKDEDAEHGEDLNHSEDEEEKKDEECQKDKEQRKDKDHSMSKSEKLDKLIQMVRDLDKRVVVIQNVLRFNDGSPNKEDCENGASSDDGNEEDTIAEEANTGDGRSALDDEMKKRYVMKKRNLVTLPTPTFNTPNFDTRVTSPTPTFTSPKFDLLSQESCHSGKGTNEVLMRDICKIPVFQPLMKIKKRLVQQDSQVNEDVDPPLQKKIKADTNNVPLRRSGRGQIPSIHTQPPFTGARKKYPILRPFEPVDKTRKEKMREWKMSNKRK
uniref:Uncharacterized protein n=1 Tax=Brassica oleracea var. oleracea TaxID=109376 RepID=A0A0D2ZSQ2_BRAOL